MHQMTVTLEWDDDFGPKWLNKENLEILLYTKESSNRSILRIVSQETPKDRAQEELEAYRSSMISESERLVIQLKTHYFKLNRAQRTHVEYELKLTQLLITSLGERILLWPGLERL